MSSLPDWLPRKRAKALEMADDWSAWLGVTGNPALAGVPAGEVTGLDDDIEAEKTALAAATGPDRGPAKTASATAALDALKKRMRRIHTKCFLTATLPDTALSALKLKPRDLIMTKKQAPEGAFTARILSTLNSLTKFIIEPVEEEPPDPAGLIEGYDVYLGMMPAGGATVEQAAGPKHYLRQAPATYADLVLDGTVSKLHGKRLFDGEDRGMMGYISIRAKNGKEMLGPPGPVVSFVVP